MPGEIRVNESADSRHSVINVLVSALASEGRKRASAVNGQSAPIATHVHPRGSDFE